MAEKQFDVVTLGELLIDFTDNGLSPQRNTLLRQTPEARHAMCWLC